MLALKVRVLWLVISTATVPAAGVIRKEKHIDYTFGYVSICL